MFILTVTLQIIILFLKCLPFSLLNGFLCGTVAEITEDPDPQPPIKIRIRGNYVDPDPYHLDAVYGIELEVYVECV